MTGALRGLTPPARPQVWEPTMNPVDEKPDEEQIARLLAATDADAPPPDRAVLAGLRGQATEAFAAAFSAKKRPLRMVRWLASAAAALVLVGIGAFLWQSWPISGVALGEVIDNSDKADTLHLL